MSTSAYITLRPRPDATGKCPLILRLVHNRKPAILTLNIKVFPVDFDEKTMQIKSTCKYLPDRNNINAQIFQKMAELRKLISVLEENDELNFMTSGDILERFRNRVLISFISVVDYTLKIAEEMDAMNRFSNARVYRQLASWIRRYASVNTSFEEINLQWIERVSRKWYQAGYSDNGLSVYLRTLKAVFNHAIAHKVIPAEQYPFKSYKMPSQNTYKQFLSRDQITQIENLALEENTPLWHARNHWLILFYSNGMSIADLARLTPANIQGTHIIYVRQKTSRKKKEEPVVMKITPPLAKILDYYHKAMNPAGPYLLKLIKHPDQPHKHYQEIRSAAKRFDKYMRRICRMAGITVNLTCGMARHSWANTANQLTGDKKIIQQALRHSSIKTTEIYMGSFSDDKIDELSERVALQYKPFEGSI